MSRKEELSFLNRLKQIASPGSGISVVFDNTETRLIPLLLKCDSNPAENDFPDFLFPGGAMEHFEIGSAPEGRKGSKFKRHEFDSQKNNEEVFEQEKEDFLRSDYRPRTGTSVITKAVYNECSYLCFLQSLKRNWSMHTKSLKKSLVRYETVVFLMEQQTPRMMVYKNQQFQKWYRLSDDKRALSIIQGLSDGVRYAVYAGLNYVELIDLNKLSEMISRAECFDCVKVGRHISTNAFFFIDW